MNAVLACLRPFDDAWQHKWESLRGVLEGVTEEEANWQAPCYAKEEREEGWPPPGTIRWQVAHIAHCKRHYTDCIRTRGEATAPAPSPRAPTTTYAEDRAELDAAHEAQRAAIAECQDTDLGVKVGSVMPLAEFLAMATRHDTWHAGQIAVARRLWRTRS